MREFGKFGQEVMETVSEGKMSDWVSKTNACKVGVRD